MAELSVEQIAYKYYLENNFLVKDINKGQVVYVFVSSHGIYKNSNFDELVRMHENDYYERSSISQNKKIISNAKKIIYIRDVLKHFYHQGINPTINTIEKIADFINLESQNNIVYLIGSSSGGYLSFILSTLVRNVGRIVSLGGVIDLSIHSTYQEMIQSNVADLKYENPLNYINKSTYLIHFFSSAHEWDLQDFCKLEKEFSNNIYFVPICLKSNKHAPSPSKSDLVKILTCTDKHLELLKKKIIDNKPISVNRFAFIDLGVFGYIFLKVKALINRSYKK